MLTEENLSAFTLNQLTLLLQGRLEKFEQLQQEHVDRKTCELARIELDLIEYVLNLRTIKHKP